MPVPDVGARSRRRRLPTLAARVATLALVMPAGALAARPPTTPPHAVNVQLLAINDFHGNLEPPGGSGGRSGRWPTTPHARPRDLPTACSRAASPTLPMTSRTSRPPIRTPLVVSAGDNIGATPLISAAFHDEPTIEALNLTRPRRLGRRQPRVRRGGRRAAAHAERRLPSDRRLPDRPRLRRRRLPVPGRERRLQGHRQDDPACLQRSRPWAASRSASSA